MEIYTILREGCFNALKELYHFDVELDKIQIEETNPEFIGDFTIVVFPFLRFSKKPPHITAQEIGEYFIKNIEIIENFEVVKGFLNLKLKTSYWVDFLSRFMVNGIQFKPLKNPKTILIEYSSPNTNKPLHLGHIRNNLIGHSISEILKARGHKVFKANLINDRGIHICKSMLSYILFGENETPESTSLKGDKLVGEYYVRFDSENNKEAETLVKSGIDAEDAKKSTNLMTQAKEMLVKWENNDPEIRKLWQTMNDWTLAGHDTTYNRMGISFDKTYFESQTYLLGKDLVNEGLQKSVFFKKEDGSVWCDLKDKGLDEKLLLRADGTSVYMTQDLGTAQLKYDDFKADISAYVVGNEQDYHFNVLKLILQKLEKPFADTIKHLSYGMVELPEGKMKTREGTVVDADDLMDEMATNAKEIILESGKMEDVDQNELVELSETIGLGALKYFILKTDIKKNIIFNPKESIDFQGHTGPFIQYSYARIKSIFRKGNIEEDYQQKTMVSETNPIEIELLKKIYFYEKSVDDASTSYNPSEISNYVFELAKVFNRFYHEVPILKETNKTIRNFRLQLSWATAETIQHALKLLGINVPERM